MADKLSYDIDDGVCVITMDDGKANALGSQTWAELNAALDAAEQADAIVILTGRDGMMSGGFDLKEMGDGPQDALELTSKGSKFARRGEIFSPKGAMHAGFFDRVVPAEQWPMAIPMAGQMFKQANAEAFKNTKLRSRKEIFKTLDQAIEDDLDPAKVHAV